MIRSWLFRINLKKVIILGLPRTRRRLIYNKTIYCHFIGQIGLIYFFIISSFYNNYDFGNTAFSLGAIICFHLPYGAGLLTAFFHLRCLPLIYALNPQCL